jgi:hypothetical protein
VEEHQQQNQSQRMEQSGWDYGFWESGDLPEEGGEGRVRSRGKNINRRERGRGPGSSRLGRGELRFSKQIQRKVGLWGEWEKTGEWMDGTETSVLWREGGGHQQRQGRDGRSWLLLLREMDLIAKRFGLVEECLFW